jgi:hypothetical protein
MSLSDTYTVSLRAKVTKVSMCAEHARGRIQFERQVSAGAARRSSAARKNAAQFLTASVAVTVAAGRSITRRRSRAAGVAQ